MADYIVILKAELDRLYKSQAAYRGWTARYRREIEGLEAQLKWQPIQTAPKDGTRILLAKIAPTKAIPHLDIPAKPAFVWWAISGHWSDKWRNWNDGVEPTGLADPNYWMHLKELEQSDE